MNKSYNISKVEDLDGANYIIRSCLTTYESKKTADKYSIKSVKKGKEHYKINGDAHQLVVGNFIIINPGQDVEINIDSLSEVEGICYFLDPTLIKQIKYSSTNSVEVNLDNINSKENFIFNSSYGSSKKTAAFVDEIPGEELDNIPINSFHTFLNNYLQTANFSELDKYQITEHLILLAEDMVRHHTQTKVQLNELEGIKTTTKKELYKSVQNGRQYIHDNFERPITLKEIAKAACLSEYYYHRNFRNFFNMTPYQYHNAVRMSKANKLLNQGIYSKKEVAFMCGFQDSKYFAKAYKKWNLS